MSNFDTRHLFLFQSDVNGFEDKYAPVLVTDVERSATSPLPTIFSRNSGTSFHARVAWINKYLDGDINLQGNDTFRPDRSDTAGQGDTTIDGSTSASPGWHGSALARQPG